MGRVIGMGLAAFRDGSVTSGNGTFVTSGSRGFVCCSGRFDRLCGLSPSSRDSVGVTSGTLFFSMRGGCVCTDNKSGNGGVVCSGGKGVVTSCSTYVGVKTSSTFRVGSGVCAVFGNNMTCVSLSKGGCNRVVR